MFGLVDVGNAIKGTSSLTEDVTVILPVGKEAMRVHDIDFIDSEAENHRKVIRREIV
jgi:hypothetical protein